MCAARASSQMPFCPTLENRFRTNSGRCVSARRTVIASTTAGPPEPESASARRAMRCCPAVREKLEDRCANAFLVIPQGEHNAWLFTLMHSPTSELAFPIPGVAYLWQPSDDFLRVNIGLPFRTDVSPHERGDAQTSVTMLLRTVNTRATTYHLTPQVGLFTGYDWSNESYFLADRQDSNEPFLSYDQRVVAPVKCRRKSRRTFCSNCPAGYAFDRFFFQGTSYSDNNNDRVDVEPRSVCRDSGTGALVTNFQFSGTSDEKDPCPIPSYVPLDSTPATSAPRLARNMSESCPPQRGECSSESPAPRGVRRSSPLPPPPSPSRTRR